MGPKLKKIDTASEINRYSCWTNGSGWDFPGKTYRIREGTKSASKEPMEEKK